MAFLPRCTDEAATSVSKWLQPTQTVGTAESSDSYSRAGRVARGHQLANTAGAQLPADSLLLQAGKYPLPGLDLSSEDQNRNPNPASTWWRLNPALTSKARSDLSYEV